MEARDWARALIRRLWIVILVPLLAGGTAAGLFFAEAVQYRAKATVVVPLAQGLSPSFNVVSQSVANFRGALTSDAVAEQTSSQTGVAKADILGGISSTQLGGSDVVEMVYVGRTASESSKVVEAQARNALAFILKAASAPAVAQHDAAQQDFDAAQQAITSFLDETGLVIPSQVFHDATARLIRLRDQLDASGRSDPALEARIKHLQQTQTQLVTTWDTLQVRRQRALNSLYAADGQYLAAQSVVSAAQEPDVVISTRPGQVPRLPRLIRQVAPAVAVGFVLAIGLVALLEVIRPSPRVGQVGELVPRF